MRQYSTSKAFAPEQNKQEEKDVDENVSALNSEKPSSNSLSSTKINAGTNNKSSSAPNVTVPSKDNAKEPQSDIAFQKSEEVYANGFMHTPCSMSTSFIEPPYVECPPLKNTTSTLNSAQQRVTVDTKAQPAVEISNETDQRRDMEEDMQHEVRGANHCIDALTEKSEVKEESHEGEMSDAHEHLGRKVDSGYVDASLLFVVRDPGGVPKHSSGKVARIQIDESCLDERSIKSKRQRVEIPARYQYNTLLPVGGVPDVGEYNTLNHIQTEKSATYESGNYVR